MTKDADGRTGLQAVHDLHPDVVVLDIHLPGMDGWDVLTEVKSGAPEVRAPFYSHMRYDIVPDAHVVVRRPDVVIVEGLNVLQPPPAPNDVAVSDLFDFSVYVDADAENITSWYIDRFLALRVVTVKLMGA